jgi:hypothetical protein
MSPVIVDARRQKNSPKWGHSSTAAGMAHERLTSLVPIAGRSGNWAQAVIKDLRNCTNGTRCQLLISRSCPASFGLSLTQNVAPFLFRLIPVPPLSRALIIQYWGITLSVWWKPEDRFLAQSTSLSEEGSRTGGGHIAFQVRRPSTPS